MNHEELLIEAKRRFSIGDFHSGQTNSSFEVENIHWAYSRIYGGSHGCIYNPEKNTWAKNLSRVTKIIQIY